MGRNGLRPLQHNSNHPVPCVGGISGCFWPLIGALDLSFKVNLGGKKDLGMNVGHCNMLSATQWHAREDMAVKVIFWVVSGL